jgi:hypothetical protein
VGAEVQVEEPLKYFPTPLSWPRWKRGREAAFLSVTLRIFVLHLFRALINFFGQATAEGKGVPERAVPRLDRTADGNQ